MFGKGFKLFTVMGFDVRIDTSWLLLAILIVLSLTRGYFPLRYAGLGGHAYLLMGTFGALGLFASIIIHELCHSLVGRRFGMPMTGITLFMFGGVSQMNEESRTPRGELLMAAAGPLASFMLAGGFYLLSAGARIAAAPAALEGVLAYLSWINLVLAFFNLLPAFPLDGGRILRSTLWAWKRNLAWATRMASGIGAGFGDVLVILGILSMLGGNTVGGLWWCLIGLFLRGLSNSSYRQSMIRDVLGGEPVRRLMHENPIAVPPALPVADLVTDFIYRHHHKMFPVVDGGELVGCVTTRDVAALPREDWTARSVRDIAAPCSTSNMVSPDTDAMAVLSTMNNTGASRLMVVENRRLIGMITLKDVMNFMTLKLELEHDKPGASKWREDPAG